MIRFRRLFENHLADPAVSADELHDFVEDFLGRLRQRSTDAAQGALCSALVAKVEPAFDAFDAFDAALGRRATVLATQQGGTISKDDALRLVRARVRQREGRVRDAFDRGSAGYAEFFPRGTSEYHRATLAQMPALLDRFIAAAEKHAAKVGADLAAEFRQLRQTFASAREDQVGLKGETADARAAVAAARAALELAAGAALLDLAKANFGQPERAEEFFNQSLLEDPTRSAEGETPAAPAARP